MRTAHRSHLRLSVFARILGTIFLLLGLVCVAASLSGCDESEEATTRPHVTVSVWDESVISSGFADYLDSLNPHYDIEWLVGDDSLDFYQYQAEEGSLPDVILVKDFNRSTATALSSSLYDLSETDIVSSYDSSYLSQIPGNGDAITYLPGEGGFEGILINEYLFDLYSIPVPTDRASFLQACQTFSEKGIRGFVAGMGDPETCYEVMQGFADESLVSETEDLIGQLLQRDPSITVDSSALDDSLTYIETLIDAKVFQKSDLDLSPQEAEAAFINGDAAMFFLSGGEAATFGKEHNMTVRALPFFGSSSSWAVAEPAFIGMVSNVQSEGVSTVSDETLHSDALTVLTSIMSSDAQTSYRELNHIDAFVSPLSDTTYKVSNTLAPLEGCIRKDNVRLYLPNQETNQAIGTMFKELVTGAITTTDAVSESATLLQHEQAPDTTVVTSFTEGVSCLFDDNLGNVAASDIAQVVATETACDFFISSALTARCPLYAGDKTRTELAYPVASTPVYMTTLTGHDIEELISTAVAEAQNEYDLPVLSGLHIEVSKTKEGYRLASVERIVTPQASDHTPPSSNTATTNEGRVETEPLNAEDTYTLGLSCYPQESLHQAVETYHFIDTKHSLQAHWIKAFTDKTVEGLPAYQDYFAFTQA